MCFVGRKMGKKWYVVFEGKAPGVYEQWEHVQKQVNMVPGNSHKSFKTKEEAEYRYKMYVLDEDERKRGADERKRGADEWKIGADERKRRHGMKTYIGISIFLVVIAIVFYVIVV